MVADRPYLSTDHPIHFMFDFSVGFPGCLHEMVLLPVGPNPRWRWLPSSIILNGHISATIRPIHFIFGSRVRFFGSVDPTALHLIGRNTRSRPSAVLYNFEWPYL